MFRFSTSLLTRCLTHLTRVQIQVIAARSGIRGIGGRSKSELAKKTALYLCTKSNCLEPLTIAELKLICRKEGISSSSRIKARLVTDLLEHLVHVQEGSILYRTNLGTFYRGDSVALLNGATGDSIKNKVDLLITSPPFPLNEKKKYGNLVGEAYRRWFESLAVLFSSLLAPTGSIVIELGNAWEPGRPVQSLLHLDSLISFVRAKGAHLTLCQSIVCYNPARLPSPAQWVTVDRIRLTDSYTHVWWISKSDRPKADNRRVLRPYSQSMVSLIERGKYNAGVRPSEHRISESGFLRNHRGSIMPNVIELDSYLSKMPPRLPENMLRFSNTNSNDSFLRECRRRGIEPHPARMPRELVAFFVDMLTEPGDLVLDPFAGSNTTGYVAEQLKRRWISIEANVGYGMQSALRFEDKRRRQKGA